MKPEENTYYIPAEDEPSVFSSDASIRECGSASFNDRWTWPLWFKAKQIKEHCAEWREKNPDASAWHCPPMMFAQDPVNTGINLARLLRNQLKASWAEPPVFDPPPTMFIGDTRKISLRWVLQYARDNNMDPSEAALVAEHERDLGGLTLNDQAAWKGQWWKEIMELPGIGYPIWRYKDGHEHVAIPFLLMPGPLSESIVIVRVHEKNPNISYKLVTIRQKGGEVVGEFTGYEGFDRVELDSLLKSFRAGFWS